MLLLLSLRSASTSSFSFSSHATGSSAFDTFGERPPPWNPTSAVALLLSTFWWDPGGCDTKRAVPPWSLVELLSSSGETSRRPSSASSSCLFLFGLPQTGKHPPVSTSGHEPPSPRQLSLTRSLSCSRSLFPPTPLSFSWCSHAHSVFLVCCVQSATCRQLSCVWWTRKKQNVALKFCSAELFVPPDAETKKLSKIFSSETLPNCAGAPGAVLCNQVKHFQRALERLLTSSYSLM